MIIKSKGYKSEKAFKTVVRYVLKEEELEQGFLLTRFIKGKDKSPEAISRQFYLNEQYRIHKRKNNVKLYMDILSFKKEDSKHLKNDNTLKKIARKYILLRANHSISIATVHRDKDHTHLHIVYGIEYKTGRSVRISKEAFQNDIKLEMERFQEKEFPELALSKIDHLKNVKKKALIKDAEYQMQLRNAVSEKQKLIQHLNTIYTKVSSEKDFYKQIQFQGYQLYYRNNKVAGIQFKRRFRLRTLGYTQDVLKELNQNLEMNKRLQRLQQIKKLQSKNRDQSKGRERKR